MIGGYIRRRESKAIEERIEAKLQDTCKKTEVWDNGYLFHVGPFNGGAFNDDRPALLVSDDSIALSEDVLAVAGPDGEYRSLDLSSEFRGLFCRRGAEAFDEIAGDFRMVAVRKEGAETVVFLVSNRAGSGRIYYHETDSGILFSSDLRFLLSVVESDVSKVGIYAILKYGAVPEPMTIGSHVSAVPPAHYLRYDLTTGESSTSPFFKFTFPCKDEVFSGDDRILQPVRDALQRSSRFLARLRPAMLLSGGIDSSLYGCYLSQSHQGALRSFYCRFGPDDPEYPLAGSIAQRMGTELEVASMEDSDALPNLEDVVRLTDHPFADVSSLPVAFLLKFIRERAGGAVSVIECNGGDDCFGFLSLTEERMACRKQLVPRPIKALLSRTLQSTSYWKWQSRQSILARVAVFVGSHELSPLDYFLVMSPARYLGLERRDWDETLQGVMETVFSGCEADPSGSGFEAKTTIRQLLHVNSRRWAAKALSVGEGLGLRVLYPYIWREVLVEQGKVPWSAKVRDGIIKWPLKRLLEEFMPPSFIYRKKSGFIPPFARWLTQKAFHERVRDVLLNANGKVIEIVPRRILAELLDDALGKKKLRPRVLNFLWGAVFTEMWIARHFPLR